jgi:hypothetical protein
MVNHAQPLRHVRLSSVTLHRSSGRQACAARRTRLPQALSGFARVARTRHPQPAESARAVHSGTPVADGPSAPAPLGS